MIPPRDASGVWIQLRSRLPPAAGCDRDEQSVRQRVNRLRTCRPPSEPGEATRSRDQVCSREPRVRAVGRHEKPVAASCGFPCSIPGRGQASVRSGTEIPSRAAVSEGDGGRPVRRRPAACADRLIANTAGPVRFAFFFRSGHGRTTTPNFSIRKRRGARVAADMHPRLLNHCQARQSLGSLEIQAAPSSGELGY
jgi:hypothetical protein